jgi:uncharacterized protein involved in exopolysaccharide biosynthesis
MAVGRDGGGSAARRPNADTSSEPEGITRRVVLNILEAFFRRPWLHLVPLILLTALSIGTAFDHGEQFRSVATMKASDESLLSDVTATNDTPYTFETPAQRAAEQMNLLLATDPFMHAVSEQAGVVLSEQNSLIQLRQLRQAITTSVAGDSLLQVAATTDEALLSQRLANATVAAYIDHVAATSVTVGTDTEASLQTMVDEARRELDDANQVVKDFLTEHPEAAGADASPVLAQDLTLYQLELERAVDGYSDARQAQAQARLEGGTASDIVRQRNVRLIEAGLPAGPEPVLRDTLLTVAVFVVLGLLLSLASVVVAATLDHTVRIPEDVRSRFGLDVLAVVPDARA